MTSDSIRPRVLVAAASKRGATAQIANHIGETLRRRGCEVTVADAADVDKLDGYDAVVLGSAVYAGHWLDDAKVRADRIAVHRLRPTVWLFSSGPVGDPPRHREDPVNVAAITDATTPREHRVFAGKIDKSQLDLAERAIMIAVRAPDGDFRALDAIAAWANEIADTLQAASAGQEPAS